VIVRVRMNTSHCAAAAFPYSQSRRPSIPQPSLPVRDHRLVVEPPDDRVLIVGSCVRLGRWRELSIAPPASGEAQTFRVTHPFHPLRGRAFPLVDCRQTWGEDRVYFYDDSGHLARLPLQWTDVLPGDLTVVVGAGRAHFRYDDLCQLADLVARLDAPSSGGGDDREC
jgi:hypothetical protein